MRTSFHTISPMKHHSGTMKRDGTKTGALISRKTRLVSPRFTFRFTPHAQSEAVIDNG
jgi:hypothetical protein